MPRQKNPTSESLEISEDQPIVMFGQPGNLHGDLYVENRSTDRVMLRRVPLAVTGLDQTRLKAGKPARGLVVRLKPGVLRPGHSGKVSLALDLDPYTPPGEYQAEVEIAGQTRPVVVHVTEKVSVRMSPAQLIIENRPGQKITKRIIVSNLGNVPLSIGEIGAVPLDDDLLYCRTLRAAAAAVGDDLRPLEEYLAQILLSAKHVAESGGSLRVRNLSGEALLQPGEIRPIDLEIRVPSSLDKRGRYRGVVAIYSADLTFLIVPTSGPSLPEESEAPKRRPARGKAGQSSEKEQ